MASLLKITRFAIFVFIAFACDSLNPGKADTAPPDYFELEVSGDNLLVNGSFEFGPETEYFIPISVGSTEISGWTVTRGAIDYAGTLWQHSDGQRSLDLSASPSVGGVVQTVNTIPGHLYRVRFDLAGNFACSPQIKMLQVTAAGQTSPVFEFDVTGHTETNMGWETKDWSFVAQVTEVAIELHNCGESSNCGPALDNVVVTDQGPYVDGPLPYEFLSVEADQQQYQNGDSVPVHFAVQNNWADGSDIQIFCKVYGSVEAHQFTAESTSIPQGQTYQFDKYFDIPVVDFSQEFDAQVWIVDDGEEVASATFHDVFQSTPLSPQEIQDGQAAVSACLPPAAACGNAMLGLVPVVGNASDVLTVVDGACNVAEGIENGDYLQAGVGGVTAALVVSSPILDKILFVGNAADFIISGVGSAISCGYALIASDSSEKAGGPANADSLALDIWASLDSLSVGFSNQIVVDGLQNLRVHNSGFFTDADTLGLKRAFVVEVDSTTYSWAHLGLEPVPVGQDTIPNPTSEILAELHASVAGEVDVALLHRNESGVVSHVQYEPFSVTENTVCWIELSDDTEDFGIRVDYEGDGVIDHIHFATGQVAGVDDRPLPSVVRATLHDAYPNPFNPQTTISFELPSERLVSLFIYDLSGRLVDVLLQDEVARQGRNEVIWNARDQSGRQLPSGTYFYRLEAGGYVETKRMTLLK
jgi:choice-of-anchor C domain-containing protein